MTDTAFTRAVIVSVGTHVVGLAAAAGLALGHGATPPPAVPVPIEVVTAPEEKPALPLPPKPERRTTTPKPVRRVEAREPAAIQPSRLIEDTPALDMPAGARLSANVPSDARLAHPEPLVTGWREGGAAGAGQLFSTGDLPVRPGPGPAGGSGAGGRAGAGPALAGTSDAAGAGVTSFARPLGGYQTTPRYPESARTAGIEGTSVLRFVVLADGLVGTINVEKSAGHPDLDRSAIEAVKSWRFEPARRGKEPVPVWVTIPVRFELKHH
jgi:periplasmic protein TonB